ncbi:MAG TPA: DUF885 domain-containing protein, partial [Kofleriaceae bacterium]|nr:DUF885 domain-containing protein [Kofleriaceae bacterium]
FLPPIAAALGAMSAASACGSGAPSVGAPAGTGGTGSGGGRQPPSASAPPLSEQAAAGVQAPELAALLREHWEWTMRRSPVWATTLGDHRFDDRLEDNSTEAIAADRARVRDFLARALALPTDSLAAGDRITLELFIGELDARVAGEVCDSHLWTVSARSNPVASFNVLPEMHKVVTPADGRNLLARYRLIPRSVDNGIVHLRSGAEKGLFANAESVRRTIALIDGQMTTPIEKWSLLEPAAEARKGWAEQERTRFADSLRQVVEREIRPAFARYREVLADEILPRARGPKKVGVGHLPHGMACYQARIAEHTGLTRTAAALHKLGQAEIKRINREMVELGRSLFGKDEGGKLSSVVHKLRTDSALYYRDAQEVVRAAEEALAAAKQRMPDFFGRLPRADCVVVPIPDYEAPFTTVAYYREPHFDGTKPGEYFINTYKPEVRPRFEMQALTFHESIPGHHLQIALGQEQPGLPAFRRFLGSTAFVEGWALYTERLAEEMKLYSGDLDRMGMLSYDAWRASRLVVDTGIHAMGWTRAEAEAFMREHTALTEENIRNEVDRYISWPGQALAYKVGQLEIVRLRREAEKALGSGFDLRRFHDRVLENGAVTLPVLAAQIARWIEAEKAPSSK